MNKARDWNIYLAYKREINLKIRKIKNKKRYTRKIKHKNNNKHKG